MHSRFGLTLMVNHACNLRCGYCFTGEKLSRPMPFNIGCRAIDRAVRSIAKGGTLELGFFGGEPLIEAAHILEWIEYAERETSRAGQWLRLNLTTNGTVDTSDAWRVMRLTALELAISHDGLPHIHDRHRLGVDGRPSSDRVIRTIQKLLDEARSLRIVLVVRPDSVAHLPAGLDFLYTLGVRQFDPSLDLWTPWDRAAIDRLASAVASVQAWPIGGETGCPIAACHGWTARPRRSRKFQCSNRRAVVMASLKWPLRPPGICILASA
jgi:uncharacterized protein